MANKKTTKRALVSSAVSLTLCSAMLLGTTMAWFTDTVSSGNNVIKSGKLDVELYHMADKDNETVNVGDNADYKVFDYDKWEPGYTRVETLKVANEGNLAFKFSLIPNIPTTTSDDDKTGASLADVIDVYVYPGESTASSWENVRDTWKYAGNLASVLADEDGMAWGVILPVDGEGTLPEGVDANAAFLSIGESTMSVALHMREEAGNEYQNLDLGDLYLTLEATQFTYEEDSFDQMYDEMASEDDWIYVYTGEQLDTALELTYDAKIKVMRDINVVDQAMVTNDMLLDLNGYTITDERAKGMIAWVQTDGGLTIVDNSKDNTGSVIKHNHDNNMFYSDGKLYIMEGTYKYTDYVWGECTKDSICGNAHGKEPQDLGALFVGRSNKYNTTCGYKGDIRIYGGYFDSGIQNPEAAVHPNKPEKNELMMAILNGNEGKPGAITVYGGTFVGANPANGDANDSNGDRKNVTENYYKENMFLEGQEEPGIVPDGYTIIEETPTYGEDTRTYYIVEYNK